MKKVFALIIGIWIGLVGLYLLFGKDYYLLRTKLDFDGGNAVVGFLLLTIGAGIFITALRMEAKDFEDEYSICATCAEPFRQTKLRSNKCPKCGGELEDLDGFYERHPELKENKKKF